MDDVNHHFPRSRSEIVRVHKANSRSRVRIAWSELVKRAGSDAKRHMNLQLFKAEVLRVTTIVLKQHAGSMNLDAMKALAYPIYNRGP